ncbi:MAG: hypothetical protein ACI9BO_000464 [Zhongshania sp.]|jgi:hypothetical protein
MGFIGSLLSKDLLASLPLDPGVSYCDVIMICFQQPFKFYDQELSITASVGSSYSESAETSVNSLIQQADFA